MRISTFCLYQHNAVTKIWTAILWIFLSLWWNINQDRYSGYNLTLEFRVWKWNKEREIPLRLQNFWCLTEEKGREQELFSSCKWTHIHTKPKKCPSSIPCSSRGVIKSKQHPGDTAGVHLPAICHSPGFPQMSSQEKYIFKSTQAIKETVRLSCTWMHFSLLQDGNYTSSPSSFMHIFLQYFPPLQFHEGSFENIWNF